ncbi:MAG: Flp family type IVb pilin [Sphingomonas sp.]|nr:Flp family type IVb pilin [Sphingomonas sp.]
MRKILRRLLAGDGGATAIEYGLIAALIAVASIGGMSALGGGSGAMWGDIETEVADSMAAPAEEN